jgi:hypothetical protein
VNSSQCGKYKPRSARTALVLQLAYERINSLCATYRYLKFAVSN